MLPYLPLSIDFHDGTFTTKTTKCLFTHENQKTAVATHLFTSFGPHNFGDDAIVIVESSVEDAEKRTIGAGPFVRQVGVFQHWKAEKTSEADLGGG